MRMCPVDQLNDGDVLGKSIFLANNRLLLGAGYRISPDIRHKLVEKGYSHVYIMEEGTDEVIPEDVISDQVRAEAQIALEDKVDRLKRLEAFQDMTADKVRETLRGGNLQQVELTYDLKKIVTEIVKDITASNVKFMASLMPKSQDRYFIDHAINTAVLAVLLGKQFRYTRDELLMLGLGAFLHDIGKVVIEQMTNGSGDDVAVTLYHEHPTFGYLLLKNDKGISPLVLQTVNQHHEQQDGKGFPIGLKGTNAAPVKQSAQNKGSMFRFAEVCAVANAYDRMLLSPSETTPRMPQDVIKELLAGAGTMYNRQVVESLVGIVPVYPVGSFVKILDIVDPTLIGCYGVVAKLNEQNLKRPTIIITANKYRKKIKPIIIDTAKLARLDLKLLL